MIRRGAGRHRSPLAGSRCCSRRPRACGADAGLPEELAITRSIDVQTRTSFSRPRFGEPSPLSARAEHDRPCGARVRRHRPPAGDRRRPVHHPRSAGAHAVNGLEDLELGSATPSSLRTRPLALGRRAHPRSSTGSGETLGAGDVSPRAELHAQRWLGRVNGQLSFAWRRSGIVGGGDGRPRVRRRAPHHARMVPTFEGAGRRRESETAYYAVPEARLEPADTSELWSPSRRPHRPPADYGVIAVSRSRSNGSPAAAKTRTEVPFLRIAR